MKRVVPWLIALGLGLAVLGPFLPYIRTHFLGLEYVDHYGTQWFYWYVSKVITDGGSFDSSALFFHPWGKDIFRHTGSNLLDAVLAVPFIAVFGQVLGYNLFVLLGMSLTAVAFYVTARDLSEDRLACGVGTVLYVLSPYILYDLAEGRPTQAVMLLPVLFVRYLLRSGWKDSWKPPAAAGLFLALAGYQYWFYAFFGGMIALGHGLWRTLVPVVGAGGRARTFARHVLIAAVALAVAAPVGVPLAMQSSGDHADVPGLLDVSKWSIYATPPVTVEDMWVGLYVWQPLHRYGGYHVVGMGGEELFTPQALLLPLVGALIAVLYLLRPGRLGRGPMLAMLAAATVVATGTFVLIGDKAIPNPIYIGLVESVGFLRRLWWPARMVAYVNVLLGLAIVQVLAWIGQVWRGRLQIPAAVALTVVWGLELSQAGVLPFPGWYGGVPAGYRCLADGPEGAIIELPYGWTQAHLYYQSAHGRPMLGGMLENNPVFTPEELVTLLDENSFVDALRNSQRLDPRGEPFTAEDKQELRDLGYAYVVLQKDAFSAPEQGRSMQDNALRMRIRRMQRSLRRIIGAPVYDDARIAIYAPWGDPTPCDLHAIEPDTVPRGPREVKAEARGMALGFPVKVQRVLEAPEEATTEVDAVAGDDAGEGAATDTSETPSAAPGTSAEAAGSDGAGPPSTGAPAPLGEDAGEHGVIDETGLEPTPDRSEGRKTP
ncbi:MAG: hypothetical protein H6742_18525 [Alphaproteobacteria bacterium]|nr:hypothetical protein [Alphaproteobacteria bacterium]